MQVVISCGGKGLRIKELIGEIPKPLVPVNGKPMLWYIMNHYSSYGFNELDLWDKQHLTFSPNVINYIYRPYISYMRNTVSLIEEKGIYINGLFEPFVSKESCYNYYRFIEGE